MIALKSVRPIVGKCSLLCGLLGVAAAGIPASAQTLIPLVNFNGSNGQYPSAALIADGGGNLFGTTESGGASGDGTVFEIAKTSSGYASTPVILVSFNGMDGAGPAAGLMADGSGNLFGTTTGGGAYGEGTVFEIAKTTTTTTGYASTPVTLVSFNGSDGAYPYAALIADGSGNLFGTTYDGGASGDGTVFEIAKTTTTTTGYASTPVTLVSLNGSDGAFPSAGLMADGSGNLFGTTIEGGTSNYGAAFEIAKTTTTATGYVSTPVTLVSFNFSDGAAPYAGLIADGSGNLFGTTAYGGASGDGTVFEIAKTKTGYASTPTTLVSFNGTDGAYSIASLIADGSGNLFGTTGEGGTSNFGTAFEIAKTTTTATGYVSTPVTLVSFNYSDGADPQAGLIADGSGNLFGTTAYGGAYYGGNGTVFEITNSGFVPVREFAGTPGSGTCVGASTSSLANSYGGIAHAASALGYNSVSALQSAVASYCSN
jgi:uncharacterized repeat protein (TIGR03803 family)